ncbi:MAG: MATE family efflux transporter [Novosphingobium sp.]|jgi:MATE family multidrug resistance protein|nr:MATE family efflux transporter [Novosphingobium sp.]
MTAAVSSLFRAELGATLRLAGPLAAANLLQTAVYALDVIFVARLGQEALAAASLAMAIFSLIGFGFIGLTGAVAPLIAAELGRRRHAVREIRRSLRMALWLAAACGLAGMGLCRFGEPFMLATGQKPAISAAAGHFIAVLSFSLVPMLIGNVLRSLVAAMGRPVFAMAVTALAIVVNALGNWILVFGHCGMPALGLTGAALATLLTAITTMCAYVIAIESDRRLRRYRLFGRWWRPEWRRLGEIVRLGVPIALTVIAEGGLFSSAAFLMGRIGDAQLAAHTVALQVAAFFFQVPFGVGQAATIRVGYHFGAGNGAAIGHAGRAAFAIGLAFAGVSAGAMLFLPHLIIGAYVDVAAPANTAMVAFAVHYLAVAAAFQLFDGAQAVAAGALRGLQDTRVPMIIAIGSYWLAGFGTAVALGFATRLEGVGIWIGLAVGLVVAAALLIRRWHGRGSLGLLPAARTR